MAGSEIVTVIREPGPDAFGDPGAGAAATFDIPGCLFAPGPSRELGIGTNQVDTDATVYAPPGVDVLPTDKIRARGVVYTVVGDPQDWGSAAGVVIPLRRFR